MAHSAPVTSLIHKLLPICWSLFVCFILKDFPVENLQLSENPMAIETMMCSRALFMCTWLWFTDKADFYLLSPIICKYPIKCPTHIMLNTLSTSASHLGGKIPLLSLLPVTIRPTEWLYHIEGDGGTKTCLHPQREDGGRKAAVAVCLCDSATYERMVGSLPTVGRPAPCLMFEGCRCLNNPPCVLCFMPSVSSGMRASLSPHQLSEPIMGGAHRPFVFLCPFDILTSHSELIVLAWCALCFSALTPILLLLLLLLYFDFRGSALNCKCEGRSAHVLTLNSKWSACLRAAFTHY